jgi:hypothetical protein
MVITTSPKSLVMVSGEYSRLLAKPREEVKISEQMRRRAGEDLSSVQTI